MIKSRRLSELLSNTVIYILLAVLSIVWLIPIIWLVLQSFRAELGSLTSTFFPRTYTIQNYIDLFVFDPDDNIRFGRWYLNTLIVSGVTCIISTVMVLLSSYAFSRLRFAARQPIMKVILVLGLFPGFMSMIAIYNILKMIGLTGSIWGLILVYSGGAAMGYYISKGYFDTIPKSIDEAAMIDGANKAQIFWYIILPLSRPIVIYTALTSFIGPWGDYIFASLMLGQNTDQYTVATGLFWMVSREAVTYYFTQFAAGAVIVAIPITLLFIFLQKYYVSGVTGGSVKG
jgi:arabinogalactan oligomer / maltooligosaccharide transport system permease protein